MDGRADVTVDVAIVGGGIAGAALATVLARDGYEVLLLERQTSYRDKVRGEVLCCWGVAEMLALDLEKPLLDAGGHYVTRAVPYDEVIDPAAAEANAVPLDRLLPGSGSPGRRPSPGVRGPGPGRHRSRHDRAARGDPEPGVPAEAGKMMTLRARGRTSR